MTFIKIKYFFLFIILFLSISFFPVSGENIDFAKRNFPGKGKEFRAARSELEQGNYCFGKSMFADAYGHFVKANEFNPDNAELNYKIAYCLLNLSNKPDALEFLLKAETLDNTISSKYKDFYYAIGLSYQYKSLWEKAIEYYNKQVNLSTEGGEEVQLWKDKANKRISECNTGKIIGKDTTFVIAPLDTINSEFDDYSNMIIQDSLLLFTSRRSRKDLQIAQIDNKFYEGIFASQFLTTKVSFPRQVSFDQSTNHYAVAGGSEDKNTLLIYTNKDIFSTNYTGRKWSTPKVLHFHTNSQESSAWICNEGKTIYFVSDMPGGIGGKDIYVTYSLSENEWTKPENLGESVNTPYDEEGVFVSHDTMYFGSKGHNTIGDFDVFMTYKSKNQWVQAINIGMPFNSPFNDLYYFKGGEVAYVSSDRTGGKGDFDIYKITRPSKRHKDTTKYVLPIEEIIKKEILPKIDTTPKPDTTKKVEPAPVITEVKKDTVIPTPVVIPPVVEEAKKDTVKPEPVVIVEKVPEPVIVEKVPEPVVEKVPDPVVIPVVVEEVKKDTVIPTPVIEEKKPEPVVVVVPEPVVVEEKIVEEKQKPEPVIEIPVETTVPQGVITDFAYCMVQVGAYRFVRSIHAFHQIYRFEGYILTMEKHGNVNKFLIDKKFYNTDSAGIFSGHNAALNEAKDLQLKSRNEYHVRDAFIAIYNKEGKRVAIIWDVDRMKYKLFK